MKRILLFVMTNLAVMVVLGIVINLFGLNRFIDESGLNVGGLLVFSLVIGFGGAIISLLMSKCDRQAQHRRADHQRLHRPDPCLAGGNGAPLRRQGGRGHARSRHL